MGRQLAERYARDAARAPLLLLLDSPLEIVKFVCKEFWGEVFRKSIDNLRTNHRWVGEGGGGSRGGGFGASGPTGTAGVLCLLLPCPNSAPCCPTAPSPIPLASHRRGTFVLRDTQFRWLTRLSQNQMPAQVCVWVGGGTHAAYGEEKGPSCFGDAEGCSLGVRCSPLPRC